MSKMIDCKHAHPTLQIEAIPKGQPCPCKGKNPRCRYCEGTGTLQRPFTGRVKCLLLSNTLGFACSLPATVCATCDAKVPLDSEVKGKSAEESKTLGPRLRHYLKARLLAGEAPRYQKANPLDTAKAFKKYVSLTTRREQVELLRDMVIEQARLDESKGGLSKDRIISTVEAIAEEHGLTMELEDVIAQHLGYNNR